MLGILGFIPALLALVAEWIGVMAMRKRKGKGWWLMAVGVGLSTLGPLVALIGALVGFANVHSSGMGFEIVIGALMLGSAGGSVLFAIGFALHGLGVNAALERQEQLETMAAAMANEMQRLRE